MKAPDKYVAYHVHSMLSNGTTNIDSVTNFRDYIKVAKECNMPALGISEHGNLFEWLHKKEAIEKAGMKYLHCVETYITEFTDTKVRDNYHCVLIAKNYEGVQELNKLISRSFRRDDFHFYYMPRISMEELRNTSDNIIVTSACLGGILNNGTDAIRESFISFLANNKHRCWLEIQHHNCKDQIEYNKYLYKLSQAINVPLIAGTDAHALNDEHMDGRAKLQKAKGVHFENEDEWDLIFKTTEQLIKAYENQNSLPMDIVYEAINNTVKMAESVEKFELDYSAKYPKLYEDSESVFKKKINEGVVRRGIISYPNYKDYVDRIHYEYDTYKHNNAIDFMLLEEDYKSEMRRRNVRFGYSRGSVSGSVIAYILGITEIDSIKYNLNFERFMNKERVSLADIDTDWLSEDREIVKEYLYQKKGLHCCDIVTFNTIEMKGAVRDICRAFHNENVENLPSELRKRINTYSKNNTDDDSPKIPSSLICEAEKYAVHKEVPYDYLSFANELIDSIEKERDGAKRSKNESGDPLDKLKKKYPDIFKYVDLLNGCVVSIGNHPAGCVVSPYLVDEWFGTCTTSTDEYPISFLNMKEIDSLNFIKLDILGLDNIGLIYKTCDAAGIPFATPDNIPPDDLKVWKSIRDDTTMIFQWESQSASAYIKQLFSDETVMRIKEENPNFSYMELLSIGNGAIRPAGESYRDKLAQGIYQDNGHEVLNEFLKPTLGYLVYQEQIINFLHIFCGYTMGEADIVRRGFAKKTGTEEFIPQIRAGFIKTMEEEYGVEQEESERIITNFLQVIEDASAYLFSQNHADPYSWVGYICGYLRYYYPLEFITTALNIFDGNEDKSLAIIAYAKKHNIKISPIKFRYSTAESSFDKDENLISKGIASIKYMNSIIADEMYALRDNTYGSFIDLLYDIKEKTSVDSRQLKILLELDFFSEFGDTNDLIGQCKLFDKFYGRKNISKNVLLKEDIPEDLIRPFVEKETEKQYLKVDIHKFLNNIVIDTPRFEKIKKRTLKDKVNAQLKHLGYLDIQDDRYRGLGVILDVNTKFSPKLKVHSLIDGRMIDCKIERKTFNRKRLEVGDIIRVIGRNYKPKSKYVGDGKYEQIPDDIELWITKYEKIENL